MPYTIMNENDRKRILQFIFLFSLLFFVIITRLGQVQFIKGEKYREESLSKRLYTQKLTPSRGEILDTEGTPIVSNRKSYNAYAVPVEYQEALDDGKANIESDSKKIASLLNIEANVVKENLSKEKSYYRLLSKDIPLETVDKLREANIPGIGIETTTVRSYPQDGLLSNVIGFVGKDGQGLEGLESTYDSRLKGEEGLLIIERDRKGNKIPSKQHEYVEAKEGQSITLTIDSQIQYIVEDELKKLGESGINPTSAYAIVQDVNTGEILALGNYPTYSPTEGGNADINNRKNGAVQFNYEPGSTFKLLTIAAGLETGAITKDSTFNDSLGYIQIANHKIKNWDQKARGTLSIYDAAIHSNNVSMVKIGQKLGKENLYDFMHKAGLGQKTNIGLYGEEAGLLKKVENVSSLDLATNTIGQSLMATPLQMINATSALVNGGNLMQPYIIKEIKDNEGKVVESTKPTIIRRLVSEETSDTIRKVMRSVVTEGGAEAANIEGFDIGGKTGTAQKVAENGAGYAAGKYVTSFVGVAPTKAPKYSVIVVTNEPKGAPVYGSTTAAPTASGILKRILLADKEVTIPESDNKNENSNN